MQKNNILVGVVVYNEASKLPAVFNNIEKVLSNSKFDFLFVNDHSSDQSPILLKNFLERNKKCQLINNKKNFGVGKSIKSIITYGIKHRYSICVVMAGNGKDNPLEIKNLLKPIISKNYDYVQGSRFLQGGSFENLPFVRKIMIKGFTFLFYLFTGFVQTDTSNGFRAYKLSIFNDRRININQSWLNRYELETYIHYKVITLGYKLCEVPVSKNYLQGVKNYSKIRPFIDWWKMMSPLFYLKLKLKY
jgi:dolichol-phosphate mannosyltransferase